MAPSPTAAVLAPTLNLYQAIIRIGDQAPEGRIDVSVNAANAVVAGLARSHLAGYWAANAREILRDGHWPAAPIPALDMLSDQDCIELANTWDGVTFESVVECLEVSLPVSALTDALRAAGLAVCVVSPSDLAPEIADVVQAGEWLAAHADELESALRSHGESWLTETLGDDDDVANAGAGVGPIGLRWRDEDWGAYTGVQAAFRLTPDSNGEAAVPIIKAAGFEYSGDRACWYCWSSSAATRLVDQLKGQGWQVSHGGRWPDGPPAQKAPAHP